MDDDGEVPSASSLHARMRAGWIVLFIARHGRTKSNAEQRFCGRSDPPLDAHGVDQARALSKWLAGELALTPRRVYASPAKRAIETARRVAEPTVLEGLAELDQGDLEGLRFAEAFERHPEFFRSWRRDPSSIRIPGGETLPELSERVVGAFASICSEMVAGESALVVTHQFAQASYLCHVSEQALSSWRGWEIGNGELRVIGRDPDRRLRILSGRILPHP